MDHLEANEQFRIQVCKLAADLVANTNMGIFTAPDRYRQFIAFKIMYEALGCLTGKKIRVVKPHSYIELTNGSRCEFRIERIR